MRVINVVTIKNGVVNEITSFGIFEEQLSQDVVEKAEADFITKAKALGFDVNNREEEEDEDDLISELLDFGYYEKNTSNDVFPEPESVCISWSDI
jgi:hypothetical protein